MTMQTATETVPLAQGDCYKYEWARFVAKKNPRRRPQCSQDTHLTPNGPGMALTIPDLEEASITDLNAMCERGGIFPPEADKFKVGIVGAGVAGLFTALLFDWLNQELG